MKLIITLLLVLNTFLVFGQSDTTFVYTDEDYSPVKAEKAKIIFKVYKKDSVNWIMGTYDGKNVIKSRETYSDSLLSYRNGQYMEFEKGKPSYKGLYLKGSKIGNFLRFDSLGRLTEIKQYVNDTLNGPCSAYWPNGAKLMEGTYKAGKRIETWTTFYENGNVAMQEVYDLKGDVIKSTYLTIDSTTTTKDKIETPPVFPGGMDKFYMFLARNIKYPKEAADANITGNVFVSFLINEQGFLEDLKVDERLHPNLDREALRVLKLSPQWTPGYFLGVPQRVRMNIPIRFSIN